MAELTPKQERFVEEYLVDLNATQAAIRAGYSRRSAEVEGSRLLRNAKVAAAVDVGRVARSDRTALTQDWVIESLRAVAERSMQAVPVRSRDGEEGGEFTFNAAGANKALELIGKHLGMFKERHEHSGLDGEPIEHSVRVQFVKAPSQA